MTTSVAPEASIVAPTLVRAHRTGLRRLFSGIVVVALALPVAAYFWFIHHYAVNTIFGDQWADINVLKHLYAGKLNLATLWTQHNEERNLFSNVVVVVLGETSHFNVVTEMYISAVLLAGAACLFIIAHKARSVSTPLFVYVPVSLILFTFAQSTNTLWGFQVAWYIVLVALATALLLLDRPNLRRLVLAGAVVAAVVGSFSLLQGLFIWPAGIVLLIQRRRSWKTVAVWVAAAVVSATVYFYNFKFNGPGTSRDGSALHHWRTTIEFFFIAIGRVVGSFDHTTLVLIGFGIVVVALWLVITGGVHPGETSARPLGVALILFGLLFAASVAIARSYLGLWPANSAEYITMDLLIVLGCYFIVTSRDPTRLEAPEKARRNAMALIAPAVAVLVVGVVGVQVVMGYDNGSQGATRWYTFMTSDEHVLSNITQASDKVVLNALDYEPEFVRQMARVAQAHHLSMFSTPTAQELNSHSPYFVAISNGANERSVDGATASRSPEYPQDVTVTPAAHKPCIRLSTGEVETVDLPTPRAPGSLSVSATEESTVEMLFFSTAPINGVDSTIYADAVDFVTVKVGESALNIPATIYGTIFLEGTSGVTRLCPATT